MKTQKSLIYFILLITGILILVNIISENWFVRLDFTADNRYTLSEATENIIEELPQPVTVKAYFSEDMPQQVTKVRSDFKDLLEEYAAISDGMLVYEFIDPAKDEQTEREVMQTGIQPILINQRDKDQVKQQKAYLGAVIEMGDKTDVIPVIQPGAAMEYALSKSLKKVSVTDKPVVGLLQGHGEPSLAALQQARAELEVMYNLQEVTQSDTANELMKYQSVSIVAPKDSFPPHHLEQLTHYLENGGNLLIAINRVDGDLQQSRGMSVSTGLETWLAEKGIQVQNQFVIDANCGSVQVRQQTGGFSYATSVEFPYLPIISNFSDHPVTTGLEAAVLQFASPLTFTGDTAMHYTALAKTSKNSGTEPASTYFNIQKQWSQNDFRSSGLTVAAAMEGNFGSSQKSRVVVIGDGDFVINGQGRQAQQQQGDNISLFVNAVDWLADDTGLIALRTKGVTDRPIEQLEDGTKAWLKYMNFLLPIILIVLYGILRAQQRKNKRYKRMQQGYVD